jgi:hypothetical protein
VSLKKERSGILYFSAALLPVILLAATSPFVFTVERYALITLPFWVILAAVGVKAIFSFVGRSGLLLALAVFVILLGDAAGENLMYYQINRGNRLDWRESVAFVQEHKQPGDVVISTRWELASYYAGNEVIDYIRLVPEDLEQIDEPIWFIMDYPGIWHGESRQQIWMEDHATLRNFSFLRTREHNYLLIYYFDPASINTSLICCCHSLSSNAE